MKIFYISARIELTKKPEWLDRFREKYDKAYKYHVTLKQPCNIEDNKVEKAKAKFEALLHAKNYSPFTLKFDELVSDKSPSGNCIMINSSDSNLNNFHAEIVKTLSEYKDYLKPMYEQFEENFQPHITIARELDDNSVTEVLREVPSDYYCEGVIQELVFLVVSEKNVEQANDRRNQTIYKLNKER